MIIDFHTHVFPDKIARRTVDLLAAKADIPPFSDGTVDGLLARMEEGGVDVAVNLPVLTNPSQFDSVNRFARELNLRFAGKGRGIVSFAGIHPACDGIEEKMAWIKENGFLGVKIHPDYQETFISDEGYVRILRAAKELDLIVVTHSGVDGGYKGRPVRCTPSLIRVLLEKVQHSKLVLAHLGANEMSREVLDLICGEDVYLDTAYVLRFIGKERFLEIVEKHGRDKILFATDSPWSDPQIDTKLLRSFVSDPQTLAMIFSENAQKLLHL